jgi:hypothetical protein
MALHNCLRDEGGTRLEGQIWSQNSPLAFAARRSKLIMQRGARARGALDVTTMRARSNALDSHSRVRPKKNPRGKQNFFPDGVLMRRHDRVRDVMCF